MTNPHRRQAPGRANPSFAKGEGGGEDRAANVQAFGAPNAESEYLAGRTHCVRACARADDKPSSHRARFIPGQ
jgi:hypothetical protein